MVLGVNYQPNVKNHTKLWELRKKRFYKLRYSLLPIILEYAIKTVSCQHLVTKPETMLPYEIEIALPETTKKMASASPFFGY